MSQEQTQNENGSFSQPKAHSWFERYIIDSLEDIRKTHKEHADEFKKFRAEQETTNSEIKETLAYQKGVDKGKLIVLMLLSGGAGVGVGEVLNRLVLGG